MQQWLILIHKICKAFPQEWDILAPVVEYLMDTEIGECGFSAHEMQTGYSLLQETDVTLAPFLVPRGAAQTDVAARLFSNFRELSGILHRHKESALLRQEVQVNRTRHHRNLAPGEIVFRRMPAKARPAKHLLGEPSAGPYVVVSQATFNSVKLKDPATGGWVDHGVDIPLEQILAGPKRGSLAFEKASGERSIGQMVSGDSETALPAEVRATGWKPGKKKGWKGLAKGHVVAYRPDASRELSIGIVHYNDRNAQSVQVHNCRSIWTGTAVCHKQEYRKYDSEGSDIVLVPTEEPVRSIIFYSALVKVVELYVDGRMMQGDASVLTKGGWSFKVDSAERIRAIAGAVALDRRLCEQADDNLRFRRLPDGACCVTAAESELRHAQERLDLPLGDVERRLREDEQVFLIADPALLMKAPFRCGDLLQQEQGCDAVMLLPKELPEEPQTSANTFTFSQREMMKRKREKVAADPEPTPKGLDVLDSHLADRMRKKTADVGVCAKRKKAAADAWMKKLVDGDYEGPVLDRS
jgi:hypothetical protein